MKNDLYFQLTSLLDQPECDAFTKQIDPALTDLAKAGVSVFLSKESFLHWLNNPSIDCKGKRPKDLMTSITEVVELIAILKRMGYGIPY